MGLEDVVGLCNAVDLKVVGDGTKNLFNSFREYSLKIVAIGAGVSLVSLLLLGNTHPAKGETSVTPTPTPTPAHTVYLPLLYKNAQGIFATPTPTPTPVLDSSDAFMSDFFYCDVNYTTQVKTTNSEMITEYYNAPNQVVLSPEMGTVLSVESVSGGLWKVRILHEPVYNNRAYGSFVSELTGFQTLDSGIKQGEVLFGRDPIGFLGTQEPNLSFKFLRRESSGNFVSGNPSNFGGKTYWAKDPVYNRPDCLRR